MENYNPIYLNLLSPLIYLITGCLVIFVSSIQPVLPLVNFPRSFWSHQLDNKFLEPCFVLLKKSLWSTPVLLEVLFKIAREWKQPACPSADECKKGAYSTFLQYILGF